MSALWVGSVHQIDVWSLNLQQVTAAIKAHILQPLLLVHGAANGCCGPVCA
jgi:hypothetical protein